jgi:hypothetical protein
MRSIGAVRLIIFVVLIMFGAASRVFHLGDHANDGKIEFGTGTSGTGHDISLVGSKSTFGPHDTMAWAAHFADRIGTTRLIRTVSLERPGKSEQLVYVGVAQYDDSNVTTGVGTRTVADWAQAGVAGSGQYVMRLYRDDALASLPNDKIFTDHNGDEASLSVSGSLLAQGSFTLTN